MDDMDEKFSHIGACIRRNFTPWTGIEKVFRNEL